MTNVKKYGTLSPNQY